MGIDMTKNIKTGKTDYETYQLNVENDACIGGPKCRYNGKKIHCFVCSSPNTSITSGLLAMMLQQKDDLGVFSRSEEEGVPFLLLDGHGSRTRLPFLEYITKPENRWVVCIGVSYGTHIWQVHDSSELHGSFKIKLSKEKKLYLKKKSIGLQIFLWHLLSSHYSTILQQQRLVM
jgi:hypothetical protein